MSDKTTGTLPQLEVDTKVIVGESYLPHFRRYFSHFGEDGRIYCFAGGNTSWSADGETTPWRYWKLAEEERE
jgi:hypothetical protein